MPKCQSWLQITWHFLEERNVRWPKWNLGKVRNFEEEEQGRWAGSSVWPPLPGFWAWKQQAVTWCTKVCLSVLKCNVKLGRGWGRGRVLLLHEDDQDLILGQAAAAIGAAAPLSISTHPTAELVPTREMDNSRTNRGKKMMMTMMMMMTASHGQTTTSLKEK